MKIITISSIIDFLTVTFWHFITLKPDCSKKTKCFKNKKDNINFWLNFFLLQVEKCGTKTIFCKKLSFKIKFKLIYLFKKS